MRIDLIIIAEQAHVTVSGTRGQHHLIPHLEREPVHRIIGKGGPEGSVAACIIHKKKLGHVSVAVPKERVSGKGKYRLSIIIGHIQRRNGVAENIIVSQSPFLKPLSTYEPRVMLRPR